VQGQATIPAAVSTFAPVSATREAFSAVANHQPLDLPHAQSQVLGSAAWLHLAVDDRLYSLESVEVLHVSCYPGVEHRQAPKSLTDSVKLGAQAPKPDICI
jgi:hypothetical protein